MALDFAALPITVRPSPDAAAFWEGVGNEQIVLPRCSDCNELFFYPRPTCPNCGSRDLVDEPVTGHGTVHAFAIHHIPPVGFDKTHVPFVTALVELAEGPRMMGLLDIDPTPDAVRCGLAVQAAFTTDQAGNPLFYFQTAPPAVEYKEPS
jgi:uncharacterized OB-fold protein